MRLEDQCVSLEYAKKLKELGIKQNSLFYWCNTVNGEYIFFRNENSWKDEISAFTISELLALLPHRITIKENEPYNSFRLRIEKGIWSKDNNNLHDISTFKEFYSINYYCETTSQQLDWIFVSLMQNKTDENLSNACAKMIIYLIENGYVKNE